MTRVRGEGGFTMIEVIVAAFILALIAGATSALFVRGEDASAGAVTNTQLVAIADQQLETVSQDVKVEGFAALAMSAAPAHAASGAPTSDLTMPTNPNYFVDAGSGGCGPSNVGFDIETNWANTSTGAPASVEPWAGCTNLTSSPTVIAEPLEVLATGFVSTAGQAVGSSDQAVTAGSSAQVATVYTYVTDTYLGCAGSGCPTTASGSVSGCYWPTSNRASTVCADARRVIVAVVPTSTGHTEIARLSPVYESAIFTAPTASNAPGGTLGLTLGVQLG